MDLSPGAAALWGKTGARSRTPGVRPEDWHPLACHMVDSAEVAGRLWDDFLAPATREWLASGLGGGTAARRLVCLLAGMHDWGKATPLFQSQSQLHARAVREAGLGVSTQVLRQGAGHAHLSAHLLLTRCVRLLGARRARRGRRRFSVATTGFSRPRGGGTTGRWPTRWGDALGAMRSENSLILSWKSQRLT